MLMLSASWSATLAGMKDRRRIVAGTVIGSFSIAAFLGIVALLGPGEFSENQGRVVLTGGWCGCRGSGRPTSRGGHARRRDRRRDPDVQRRLGLLARQRGTSVDDLVTEALDLVAASGGASGRRG